MQTELSDKLDKAGGLMEGPVDMQENPLRTEYLPAADTDVVNKGYVDSRVAAVSDRVDTAYHKLFGDGLRSWEDVQTLVRGGAARRYFDIGDQLVVERLTALTAQVSSAQPEGSLTAAVDEAVFLAKMGEAAAGVYSFSYDGLWRDRTGTAVTLAEYGLTLTGTPAVGDVIRVTEETEALLFDVIGIDQDRPADTRLTHSLTLQTHDAYCKGIVYDMNEAGWYIDAATYPGGLAAGTYQFTLPSGYDNAYGGGQTLHFTLATAVPVGGSLRFLWAYHTQASACKLNTYAGTGEQLEAVTVAAGAAGTPLPALQLTEATAHTNTVSAMRYGSNRWAVSGLRQWLNTDGAARTWWEPQTVFDRPTNQNKAGFLRGLDPAFLRVVGSVVKQTLAGGRVTETTERFFLPSVSEVYAAADETEGPAYTYYGAGHSALNAPGMTPDTNRIKYENGAAADCWLRTSNPQDGSMVYHTGTDGKVFSDIASDDWRMSVAPACVII